jgi:hypothetical protein
MNQPKIQKMGKTQSSAQCKIKNIKGQTKRWND